MEIKDKKFLARMGIETGISIPVSLFINRAMKAAIPTIEITSKPVFVVMRIGEMMTELAINYAVTNSLMSNLVDPILGNEKEEKLDLGFLETVNENSDTEE